MKKTLIVVAILLASPANAAEISIQIDDNAQAGISQLPAMLDACVSSVMVRGDGRTCHDVWMILSALANRVRTAQMQPKISAPPKELPTPPATTLTVPPTVTPAPLVPERQEGTAK